MHMFTITSLFQDSCWLPLADLVARYTCCVAQPCLFNVSGHSGSKLLILTVSLLLLFLYGKCFINISVCFIATFCFCFCAHVWLSNILISALLTKTAEAELVYPWRFSPVLTNTLSEALDPFLQLDIHHQRTAHGPFSLVINEPASWTFLFRSCYWNQH